MRYGYRFTAIYRSRETIIASAAGRAISDTGQKRIDSIRSLFFVSTRYRPATIIRDRTSIIRFGDWRRAELRAVRSRKKVIRVTRSFDLVSVFVRRTRVTRLVLVSAMERQSPYPEFHLERVAIFDLTAV